jgi:HPt (histidine-containing phosphotransfer) domain-containing protein
MTSAQIAESLSLVQDWIESHAPEEEEHARAQTEVTRGAAVIERRETMVGQAKSSRPSAGYIYILKPRISIDGREVIKIGMTTRTVAERVRELTTGSMVSFEVVYSLHVESARSFEKYLHARYRTRRLIGGGGQEFFTVPAQEVVAEVERMATDISRSRAQAARNGEIAAFLAQVGAARVESRISSWLGWLWFVCWLVGTFGMNRLAHSIASDSAASWLTALSALIVLPVILSIAYDRLKRHFMALYYEPRFRSAIDAKHQELRLKYPLAYT